MDTFNIVLAIISIIIIANIRVIFHNFIYLPCKIILIIISSIYYSDIKPRIDRFMKKDTVSLDSFPKMTVVYKGKEYSGIVNTISASKPMSMICLKTYEPLDIIIINENGIFHHIGIPTVDHFSSRNDKYEITYNGIEANVSFPLKTMFIGEKNYKFNTWDEIVNIFESANIDKAEEQD